VYMDHNQDANDLLNNGELVLEGNTPWEEVVDGGPVHF
jgi:hypothetical protein